MDTAAQPTIEELVQRKKDRTAAIRALRKKYDLSQAGLARCLGVTPSTVARWEGCYVKPRIPLEKMEAILKGRVVTHDERGLFQISFHELVARAAKAGITTEQLSQLLGEPSGKEQER